MITAIWHGSQPVFYMEEHLGFPNNNGEPQVDAPYVRRFDLMKTLTSKSMQLRG